MAQQSNPYEGVNRVTTYQPALEFKASAVGSAQQAFLHSPSLFPGWRRYVVAEPPPAIDDVLTSNGHHSSAPSDGLGANEKRVELPVNVYSIPNLEPPKQSFRLIQKWRGTVVEIRGAEFVAELHDQTNPSHPREISTFRLDELSIGDERLVALGAVFYWCIGYELTESRQRKLVAEVIFRRLPGWTEGEIAAVQQKTSEIEELLGIENSTRAAARS
jgi:hypothetical protein